MTDFSTFEYDDPKAAVKSVYHTLMQITEDYCERLKNNNLDDAYTAELSAKCNDVYNILKYNMLEIPYSVYNLLYQYAEESMAPLIGHDWEKELKKDYESYLKEYKITEAESETWSHLDGYCESLCDYFYSSMSGICRSMFNTGLMQDSLLDKIRNFFKGKDE